MTTEIKTSKHESKTHQFRNAGPMVLLNPTPTDLELLRNCIHSKDQYYYNHHQAVTSDDDGLSCPRKRFKCAQINVHIKYIAFFRDNSHNNDDSDNERQVVYHVYAQAYNKLSVAMWRHYVHPNLMDIKPIEGSFRAALAKAGVYEKNNEQNSDAITCFEEYRARGEANDTVSIAVADKATNTQYHGEKNVSPSPSETYFYCQSSMKHMANQDNMIFEKKTHSHSLTARHEFIKQTNTMHWLLSLQGRALHDKYNAKCV